MWASPLSGMGLPASSCSLARASSSAGRASSRSSGGGGAPGGGRHGGASAGAAGASADQGAGLARSLGTTLHDLAAAMSVQIFGTQPLAGLASGFDSAAGQSDELAGAL